MELWVTGAGMVTSVGGDKEECFEAFCAGRSGVAPLQGFDRSRFNAKNAYEVKDRVEGEAPFRASGWLSRAIAEALREAGLTEGSGRIAVLVGTGLRELRSLELHFADGTPMSPDQLHFGGSVRRDIPAAGAVHTINNACAASNYGLALAEDMIRLGEADVVVAAGCDTITESMFGLLDRVNPLHAERLQPFDRDRRGVLMGDGASAVVLESAEHARSRGAKPLANMLGVGVSCDAVHETAPDQAGICRAIRDAHKRSGVAPEMIGAIFVHGTGTALNDKTEAAAMAEVFPRDARNFVISGIKSMTGHTSGASGLVGVITAILSLKTGRVPPTVGLETPLDEADGMAIATTVVDIPGLRYAQINAFGFGGVNSVVMLEGVNA